MDNSSVIGILIAVVGIVAGLLIEGGNVGQVLQPTAAMIVFGGTLGAVMLQFPLKTVVTAFRKLVQVFFHKQKKSDDALRQIVEFANKARRSGIVSLDQDLAGIGDPFLKQAVMLAVDGTEPSELRKIMELQIENRTEDEERIPAVFESAGGFSPTIGIIGAVLGLIQVMQHLDKIDEVGKGIAVAFVATIYGVGAANILLLPSAGKLRLRIRDDRMHREMMLEGVVSILEGMNPRMIEIKLQSFLAEQKKPAEPAARVRNRKHKRHANHERWLVSYADFITLLFAFFVVLYSTSKADLKKQAQVASSIDAAFKTLGLFQQNAVRATATGAQNAEKAPVPVNVVMGDDLAAPPEVKQDLERVKQKLEAMLSNQIANHIVALRIGRDGLVISLREAGFYDSGSATPHHESMPILNKIAAALVATPYDLRVEGHTDNVPIHNEQFDTNWELSTTRATRLARIFIANGFAPYRLSASGYAEFHPVAENATAEGRGQNRRVDVIVLPRTTQPNRPDLQLPSSNLTASAKP